MPLRNHPLYKPLFLLLTVLPLLLAGCSSEPQGQASGSPSNQAVSENYFIFDTFVSVKVFDSRMTKDHFKEVEALLQLIDGQMNRHLEGSEINKVNKQAGIGAVQVSEDTFNVVQKALDYAAATNGLFDPTVGPLVDLWGVGNDYAKVPDEEELQRTMTLVRYDQVVLDPDKLTIKLKQPGMSLDLGAIAKGYAADEIAAYLLEKGFTSAIVDLGGNIMAVGAKPDGTPWRIGLQDPSEQRGNHIGLVRVEDKTIVASGIYERFFIENGVYYHHIFDLRTGYPVNNGMLSVTIVADKSIDADSLSTSIFSLGLEEGMAFIEAREDADAVFMMEDGTVHVSSGLKDKVEMTSPDYQLVE